MKKIFYLLALVLTLPLFNACEEDRDSNPVYQKPTTFVLNTPAYAANNTYDLQYSDSIILTTTQPNYGVTLATTYKVEVSLDKENFTELPTTYTSARLAVAGQELNAAIEKIMGDGFATADMPVYVRLKAKVTGDTDLGTIQSNVITLPHVRSYKAPVTLQLPTQMHIVGDFAASNGWSTFCPLTKAFAEEGYYYGVFYIGAGESFKLNPDAGWKGRDVGFEAMHLVDNAGASVASHDGSANGNAKVTNGGWYTVCVKVKIVSGAYEYTTTLIPAQVYIISPMADGAWAMNADRLFTAPANAGGSFVSPAFTASGEARVAIKTTLSDWWKTELTLHDGKIFYRTADIPNNWAENFGADYSVAVTNGKVMKLNFTAGTGVLE